MKKRTADMDTFLREQPTAIAEYDESLIRRLIEKVTYEDKFTVEFKSGVTVDVQVPSFLHMKANFTYSG